MKANSNYRAKKIAIAAALIIALFGVAFTGSYFYIKGNESSQATGSQKEQNEENTSISENMQNSETQNNPEQEGGANNGEVANNGTEGTARTPTAGVRTNTRVAGTTTNGRTTTTTNADGTTIAVTVNNDGTTTTTITNPDGTIASQTTNATVVTETEEIERLISENMWVGWTPEKLNVPETAAKLGIKKYKYRVEKIANLGKAEGNKESKAELGDVITYSVILYNDGNVDLKGIVVTDEKLNKTANINVTVAEKSKVAIEEKYIVSQADINAQEPIYNKVTATYRGEKKEAEAIVSVVEADKTYKLEKITTSKPANGEFYVLGETIWYSIAVVNEGNVSLNITVSDPIADEKEQTIRVEPKNQSVVSFSHKVTTEDIINKKVTNIATGNVEGEEATPSNTVEEKVDTENKEIALNKKVTSKPANKEFYVLGEVITYEVEVENKGNIAQEVVVSDPNADEEDITLNLTKLGTTRSKAIVNFTHKVTEADVTAKKVVNTATGKVEGEDTTPSNTVEEKVDTENKEIALNKKVTNEPANGEFYILDEVITYEVEVENKGNIEQRVIISDPNADEDDGVLVLSKAGTIGSKDKVYFTHKVTEADVTAKKVVNTATGKVEGEDTTPSNPVEEKVDTEIKDIALNKKVTSKPANNEFYVLGEVITYEVEVENKGNIAQEVVVSDPNADEDDVTLNLTKLGTTGSKTTVNFTHKVTEADVTAKKVTNTATGKVEGEDATPSNPVEEKVDTENKDIALNKKVTSKPANGEFYVLGEVITYEVEVENKGNIAQEVVVSDPNADEDDVTLNLTKLGTTGSNAIVNFTHKVTETDVTAKKVVNTATGKVEGEDATPSNTVEEKVDTENKDIALNKNVTNKPANGEFYVPGEVITYEVEVENKGNIAQRVVVADPNADEDDVTLNLTKLGTSGSKAIVNFTHKVTDADAAKTKVINTATGKVEGEDSTPSNTVESITNKYKDVIITKKWEDNNNQDSKRPTNIVIKLYDENNTEITVTPEITNTDSNNWNYTFKNLKTYNNNGTEINYYAKEIKIDGTQVENNGLYNDDYKTTYSGNTITNTYLKPVFNVTKTGNKPNGSVVEPGTKLTYTITIKNTGNKAGTKHIIDSDLKDLLQSGKLTLDSGAKLIINHYHNDGTDYTYTTTNVHVLANTGVDVYVPEGKTATITFEVTVSGNINDVISNTVEGSNVTYTIGKNISIKKYTGSKTPANYVLIVDSSGSMLSKDMKDENGNAITRLASEKNAIANFVKDLYEDNGNNQSTVTIIKFDSFANEVKVNGRATFGISDYAVDSTGNLVGTFKSLIDNIEHDSGTNISAGLSKAKSYMYDSYSGLHSTNSNIIGKDNNKDVFIVLSDGMPNKGSMNKDALKKDVTDLLSAKPAEITNELNTIAFGKETTNATPTGQKVQEILGSMATAGNGKKYDAANQSELFETLLQISYILKETSVIAMDANAQTIYNGANKLKKLSVTYKENGTTKNEDYDVKTTGNVGPFVYSKEGSQYKLVFNGTSYLDKTDVVVSYYY